MKVSWLLAGNIIYAFSQWLILLILSNNYSTESVGEYFFALALIAPIVLFVSLKLSNLVVTLKKDDTEKENVYSFRNILDVLVFFLVFILYFMFFKDNTSIYVLVSVLIYKILEQRDDLAIAYHQRDLKFREIFYLKFFRSIFYTLSIFLFSLYFNSIDKLIIFATLVYFLYWIVRNKKNLHIFKLDLNKVKIYIESGLSLSTSSSISSLNISGVRMYIGYVLGSSSLAIYGIISYSLTVFLILVSAISQYFLPIFVDNSKDHKKFKNQLHKAQVLIFSLCAFFIIISYLFGNSLLSFFYGDNYKKYGIMLCLIFIAILFKSLSSILGTAMTSLRIYNFQLKYTVISLFLTILSTPFLVEKYEILGAFFSLILVNFIEWLFYLYFANRNFNKVIGNSSF